jgi:charged multivesicular body protein 2A
MLDKSIRELDRERMGLQNQEKKVVAEIKKMAKEGQMVRPHGRCCCRRR